VLKFHVTVYELDIKFSKFQKSDLEIILVASLRFVTPLK